MPAAKERLLITGVSGFVGQSLVAACDREGVAWTGQVGRSAADIDNRCFRADLSEPFDWRPRLGGVKTVAHLAGVAHILKNAPGRDEKYRRINVVATRLLAEQALESGVGHFIFVSSVHALEVVSPTPYGLSKKAAEEELTKLTGGSGMRLTILRPCIMYGPGAKGNLEMMMRWLKRGLVLPFARVANARSLMDVRNFCDLLLRCVENPEAAEGVFVATDGGVFSTPELLRRVAAALGAPARLFPFPKGLMRFAARCLGRAKMAEQLLGDLTFDGSELMERLRWRPPFAPGDGFAAMAEAWLKEHGSR